MTAAIGGGAENYRHDDDDMKMWDMKLQDVKSQDRKIAGCETSSEA